MKSMFKFVLAPALLAAAALATTSASAESHVKVPFSFTAGDKICPAGDYTVIHDSTTSFVTLTRRGSSDTFTYVVGPSVPYPNATKVALTFDDLGNTHVLRTIQYGSVETSRLDLKSLSNAERQSLLSGGR